MIILLNFNTYLGGGETLFVRFIKYLESNGIQYLAICKKESFIFKELANTGIPSSKYIGIVNNCDYYYLNNRNRKKLIDCIFSSITKLGKNRIMLVSFCLRDLYTIVDLSKHIENCSITHLILHSQDYLYTCQTLLDKILYNIFGFRFFNNRKNKEFNKRILSEVNNNNGLVPMAYLGVQLWKKELGINIPIETIVPLPSFDKNQLVRNKVIKNNKSIIWIGRLVDFKLPSLFVMLDYINEHDDYSFTIIGGGDRNKIDNYIKKNKIDTSRINFLGTLDYSKLDDEIKKHSIGYASGTSIIEIVKNGLPVIMALYNYKHKNFKKQICGGLFATTSKGNIGEDLMLLEEDEIKTTIADTIFEIERDYNDAAIRCYEYTLAEYEINTNFEKYLDHIYRTKLILNKQISIHKPSIIRRIIYSLFLNN